MDKRVIEDIISSAINIASDGRVESIKHIAPEKMMTSEQVQQLHLKKEDILEALMKDPRVTSADWKDGKFHITTEDGSITFNFVFGDEEERCRFMIEDEPASQESGMIPEMIDVEITRMLFGLIHAGVTVEDVIETFLKDPRITSGEYRNGRFYFESTEGPIDFWFPFLKKRAAEDNEEDKKSEES